MFTLRTEVLITFSFPLMTLIGLLFLPISTPAQTEISGVVNQYSRVLSAGSCPTIIRVADPGLFSIGQRVLLIGMQGATMSVENNETFGTVSAENMTAGLYDWTLIQAIQGDEITLADPISSDYDFSQVVQLVGVPTYQDARVIADVLPLAWDGNLGGIVALEVNGTLELAANIDASGMGFRGGQSVQAGDDVCNLLTSANNYFYEAGNWRGAPKGEGIVPLINGREFGRGPQANGGGGANTHNAGGGGGSNRVRGGIGGENREPSFGGCRGFFPGGGGVPLILMTDRWFLGGGGGAGHRNNNSQSSGGNGGGIIVIKADNLFFSGGAVLADGLDGLPADGDGAGGGGSGGTIQLDAGSITGDVLISAKGGSGGDVENLIDRCMGPGGGGSGGQVYSNLPTNAQLEGGEPGLTLASGACPEGTNGALPGEAGTLDIQGIKPSAVLPALQLIAVSPDTSVCGDENIEIWVLADAGDFPLNYRWETESNGEWTALVDSPEFQGTTSDTLRLQGPLQDARFRVVVSADCIGSSNSEPIQVGILDEDGPIAAFAYEIDGLSATFDNLSQGADVFEWTIIEIPDYSSSEIEPEITFPEVGTYQVKLVTRSPCGLDSLTESIVLGSPPVAAFTSISSGSSCVPVTVQWMDQSAGTYDSYQWSFPGGTPNTSTDPDPVVVYETPGEYNVSLTVSGELGTDTYVKEGVVKVFSVPQPEFSYQIEGLTVSFTSTAGAALQHVWAFDDGNTSKETAPVHTYAAPGAYDVTLNLQNGGCARSITERILVFTTGVRSHQLQPYLSIGPNPTNGQILLSSDHPKLFPLALYLFDPQGRLLEQHRIERTDFLDLSRYPAGTYWIMVRSDLGRGNWQIVKY